MTPVLRNEFRVLAAFLLFACGAGHAQTSVRMEAEDMRLETYNVEALEFASGGALINLKGPGFAGSATAGFPGESGTYDVSVVYHDENDGLAQLTLEIEGESVDFWTLDKRIPGGQDAQEFNRFTRESATAYWIAEGDAIRIEGLQGNWDHANVDFIEFKKSETADFGGSVIVSADGGDYESPQDAIRNLAEGDRWCRDNGNSSSLAPCLITLVPGDYEVSETLFLPGRTVLRGSGSSVTSIRAAPNIATVVGVYNGDRTVIEDVTIENKYGTIIESYGILLTNASDIQIHDVIVSVEGGDTNVAISGSVYSSAILRNVQTHSESGSAAAGIDLADGVISNCTIEVSNTFRGDGIALGTVQGPGSVEITQSRVSVSARHVATGIFSTPEVTVFVDGVRVFVADGEERNIGIGGGGFDGSDFTASNSFVDVNSTSGTSRNTAIDRRGPTRLRDVHARASGGGSSTGVFLSSSGASASEIISSTLMAEGAAQLNIGLEYESPPISSGVSVLRSRLRGRTAAFLTEDPTAKISLSFLALEGPLRVASGNTEILSCAAVTNEANIFFADECPLD